MDEWTARAVALGAGFAQAIRPDRVVVAEWVRLKCQYGCGGYGLYLTCPPHSPTPEVTRQVLRHYERAVLLRLDVPGSNEEEERHRRQLHEVVAALERELFLAGHHRAWGMGPGPCPFCETCNLEGPCRFPRRARPSMEGCGIDVYSTVRQAGWRLEVVRELGEPFSLFGLVLVD